MSSLRPRRSSTLLRGPVRTLATALLVGTLLGATGCVAERERAPAESVNPCETPLAWHVGQVDPRFGIARQQLRQAVDEAGGVWEDALGRDLFRHDESGGMPIHLVYDERQQRYERRLAEESDIERLRAQLEGRKSQAEMLDRQLRSDRARHERLGTRETSEAYRSSVERYNRAVDRYNEAVAFYNEAVRAIRDGAGGEVQAGDLQKESRERNGRVISVRRTLTIALVGSYEELVLVLAHELGHALGLDHVQVPGTLMATSYRQRDLPYPVRLQEADRAALARLCEVGG